LALNPGLAVRAVQAAVGSQAGGSLPFRVSEAGKNLWARVAVPSAEDGPGEVVHVPATTLDQFTDEQGIREVPLVLIDVEGFENEVLAGMREGIARYRYRTILVEVHPWAFADVAQIAAMLRAVTDAGYRAFRFRPYAADRHPDKDRGYYKLR